MKYESDILKRLIDTYGVVGNPKYISEIIKEFIVQGKECYPNLFTYQADWLAHIDEFGLSPSYTVSYTGQSIYAPNTLERPVKSAILKGQTLANISIVKDYSFSSTQIQIKCYNNEMIKTNTEYTVIYDITDTNDLGSVMMDCFGNTPLPITLGSHKIKLTTLTTLKNNSNMYISGGFVGVVDNIMIIEGDHTQEDIPYFEGMQSVKMPVLTTTGKNLYNKSPFNGYIDASSGKFVSSSTTRKISDYIEVEPNKKYKVSGCTMTTMWGYDKDKNPISAINFYDDITTTSDMHFIAFTINSEVEHSNIQLEEGTVATSYEPYKSNILTVNEDVTLRGIGDVQDTLDCLTGEVTERIGEIMLDGSEAWTYGHGNSNETIALFYTNLDHNGEYKPSINDKLPSIGGYSVNFGEGIYVDSDINVRIKRNKLNASTVDNFKQWLSNNPITLQYKLNQSNIKTVDLSILDQNGQSVKQLMSFNGGTHFNTICSEGSPLPTIEVSVETDLEETLAVCSLEGNTM